MGPVPKIDTSEECRTIEDMMEGIGRSNGGRDEVSRMAARSRCAVEQERLRGAWMATLKERKQACTCRCSVDAAWDCVVRRRAQANERKQLVNEGGERT